VQNAGKSYVAATGRTGCRTQDQDAVAGASVGVPEPRDTALYRYGRHLLSPKASQMGGPLPRLLCQKARTSTRSGFIMRR
jgi:hypothetical protein